VVSHRTHCLCFVLCCSGHIAGNVPFCQLFPQCTVLSTVPMYQSIKRGLFPRIIAQTGRLESSQTAQLARWNLSHKMTSFRSICSTKSRYRERPFPRSIYRPLASHAVRSLQVLMSSILADDASGPEDELLTSGFSQFFQQNAEILS
jgi:hypothetical protein